MSAKEGEIIKPPDGVSLTKHNEAVVQLLETAFNNIFNITEACQYAGISTVTYYNWIGDDPIFEHRMSVAQKAPGKKAKQNILTALNEGDTSVAKWYLERKDPEFKTKIEGSVDPNLTRDRNKIKDFLDDDRTNAIGEQSAESDGATPADEVAPAPTDIS